MWIPKEWNKETRQTKAAIVIETMSQAPWDPFFHGLKNFYEYFRKNPTATVIPSSQILDEAFFNACISGQLGRRDDDDQEKMQLYLCMVELVAQTVVPDCEITVQVGGSDDVLITHPTPVAP
jgi:hypothetical protein